jgi:hypothetical protein
MVKKAKWQPLKSVASGYTAYKITSTMDFAEIRERMQLISRLTAAVLDGTQAW